MDKGVNGLLVVCFVHENLDFTSKITYLRYARGLSRLSDQGRMVAISGEQQTKPILQMCHCRPTYYILYIVMCDINMTTFDKGKLTPLVRGSRIFQGA